MHFAHERGFMSYLLFKIYRQEVKAVLAIARMIKPTYSLGIDIGSTTVKIAVLDADKNVLFSDYERHFSNISET